jgi:hypothetical protein
VLLAERGPFQTEPAIATPTIQLLHKEGVAKAEDGADVVAAHAVKHHRDRPTWLSKKLVTGRFDAAQLRRCQRPAHIRASRWRADYQYSSASMMVMTRSVTDGLSADLTDPCCAP